MNLFSPTCFPELTSARRETTAKHKKLAFCFLVDKGPRLPDLWEKFFEGHEAFYNIYVHASMSCRDAFFKNFLIETKETAWGDIYEAVRALYAQALQDERNFKMILLSESCVPLHDFTYIYTYLTTTPRSHLNMVRATDASVYMLKYKEFARKNQNYAISKSHWHWNETWTILNRSHASLIATDQTFYPMFKKVLVYDEYYPSTLLAYHKELHNTHISTITFVNWRDKKIDGKNCHPKTYDQVDADEVANMKQIGLFARKFTATSNVGDFLSFAHEEPPKHNLQHSDTRTSIRLSHS